MNDDLILPELICLNDYGGDFNKYEEAVYQIFKKDFVDSKPIFKGHKLAMKKYPIVNDKEYTYYHITHEGVNEEDREPSMRRMERIGYPRPIIDKHENEKIRVWKNKRGRKNRILLLHEEENYLVVLEDRGKFIIFWTAYYIEHHNKIRRLIKEYEEYINAETA